MTGLIELIFFIIVACSVAYVAFYSLIIFLRDRKEKPARESGQDGDHYDYLVIFPSYDEDRVIINSVGNFLKQDYPRGKFDVIVISDHQSDETNFILSQLPITVIVPNFDKSTKAKALQLAINNSTNKPHDYVVVMDADNIVNTDFLKNLNIACHQGYKAIQCHRCAKNSENDVAELDGISEEINNSIFRRAHNLVGLSSSLIGSGMCIEYNWFKNNVGKLFTAGEDRELESLLLSEGIYIRYEKDIHVYDEKVSNINNFQRQRQRWVTAQFHSLTSMLPNIPRCIINKNINYIDKTIQQALIPRSMLIVIIALVAILETILAWAWSKKWWILLAILLLSLFGAVPPKLRKWSLIKKSLTAIRMTLRMFRSVSKIPTDNGEFHHTTHNSEK